MTSIDKLIKAYQEEDPQPRNAELVTDQEVIDFLNKREWFWTFIFWTLFAASILFLEVVGR